MYIMLVTTGASKVSADGNVKTVFTHLSLRATFPYHYGAINIERTPAECITVVKISVQRFPSIKVIKMVESLLTFLILYTIQ